MTEPAPSPSPPHRRRRLALGLRGLMLLVLIVGAVLGWKIQRARVQKRAVARIEAAGGHVTYDYTFSGEYPYKPTAQPGAPAWLRKITGDEFFQEVTAVFFHKTWTSEDLSAIDDLDHLLEITLHDRAPTRTDLERLGRMKSIRVVSLWDEDLDDEGFACLAHLTGLRRLSLSISNRVSDDGLANLRGLVDLEALEVGAEGITGPGLAHLSALPNLRELTVIGCSIDDAGMTYVARLQGLRGLYLCFNPITDAGLEKLRELTKLEHLNLGGSLDITDAGLSHLRPLKQLRPLGPVDVVRVVRVTG